MILLKNKFCEFSPGEKGDLSLSSEKITIIIKIQNSCEDNLDTQNSLRADASGKANMNSKKSILSPEEAAALIFKQWMEVRRLCDIKDGW